eukprot:6025_1
MTDANTMQFGVFDANSSLFYILGGKGRPNKYIESIYDINADRFRYNQTFEVSYYNIGGGQVYTTFVKSNNSSFLYFTNYNSMENPMYKSNFFLFDLQNNELQQIGKLYPKQIPSYIECYTTDNKQYIYLIGGSVDYEPVKSFFKFDIYQNEWINGSSLNIARHGAACAYAENQLFVFGGDDSSTGIKNLTIETLNLSSDTKSYWKVVNSTFPGSYQQIAFYPNTANKNSNTIFIFQGSMQRSTSSICHKFNFQTYDIMHCNNYPNIYVYGALTLYVYAQNQHRLYLFGGDTIINSKYQTISMIQYAVLDYNGTDNICSWNANNGKNVLDLSDLYGQSIWGSNNQYYYRYTPCTNMLTCNGTNEMVAKLYEHNNLACSSYIAIWDNYTTKVDYDNGNKTWQFVYRNGEKCNGAETLTTLIWKCNGDISKYKMTVTNISQCQYEIVIESNYACN